MAEHRPDAILLDLHMPVLDGIETTRRLSAEHPRVAVVILTTYADDESVLEALRAGARSYLTKDADRADIASALQAAAGGLSVLDARVQAASGRGGDFGCLGHVGVRRLRRTVEVRPLAPPDGLTQREAEILTLIAQGLTNPEIAARLFLSNHTVKTHISRIFAKTGSRDRVAAIGYARRHNLG